VRDGEGWRKTAKDAWRKTISDIKTSSLLYEDDKNVTSLPESSARSIKGDVLLIVMVTCITWSNFGTIVTS